MPADSECLFIRQRINRIFLRRFVGGINCAQTSPHHGDDRRPQHPDATLINVNQRPALLDANARRQAYDDAECNARQAPAQRSPGE